MSCSVPFAFKPYELKTNKGDLRYKYHIVDGGVLDNFPAWLVDNTKRLPAIGFRLKGGQKNLLSLDTPLSIYKSLLMSVHDVGIPKYKVLPEYLGDVDCSSVGFLFLMVRHPLKRYFLLLEEII
jgi:predicted acylesterase/phospholipase RssA